MSHLIAACTGLVAGILIHDEVKALYLKIRAKFKAKITKVEADVKKAVDSKL